MADCVFCHSIDEVTPIEEVVRGMNIIIDQGMAFYWGADKMSPFLRHFIPHSKRSSCNQDRLGTNVGKVDTFQFKNGAFLAGTSTWTARKIEEACAGKKTPSFAPFYTKNGSFYQDRLGTNISKLLKKRCVFMQSRTAWACRVRSWSSRPTAVRIFHATFNLSVSCVCS